MPRSTSFRTRPGTLSGNRNALTRTDASRTALGGIRFALFIDNGEDFSFLRRAANLDEHWQSFSENTNLLIYNIALNAKL